MRIAITAQNSDTNAPVDLRFGRAPFFHIVDAETGTHEALDNCDGAGALQGAGIRAAELLARCGVETLITGHVGPKACGALQASNIRIYSVSGGTVQTALRDFKEGRLQLITEPHARGHQG